jgi:hypothetical protein
MSSEGDLGLKAQTIIDLPLESLAPAVLENYAASGAWNRHNWMLGAQNALGRGPQPESVFHQRADRHPGGGVD